MDRRAFICNPSSCDSDEQPNPSVTDNISGLKPGLADKDSNSSHFEGGGLEISNLEQKCTGTHNVDSKKRLSSVVEGCNGDERKPKVSRPSVGRGAEEVLNENEMALFGNNAVARQPPVNENTAPRQKRQVFKNVTGLDMNTAGNVVESLSTNKTSEDLLLANKLLAAQSCKFSGVLWRETTCDKKFKAYTIFMNKTRNLGFYSLASDSAYVVDRINEALKITGFGPKPNFKSTAEFHHARMQEMKENAIDSNDVDTLASLAVKIGGFIARFTQESSSKEFCDNAHISTSKTSKAIEDPSSSKRIASNTGRSNNSYSVLFTSFPNGLKYQAFINLDNKLHSIGNYNLQADAAFIADKILEQIVVSYESRRNFASLEEYYQARNLEAKKSGLIGISVESLIKKASEYVAKLTKKTPERLSTDISIKCTDDTLAHGKQSSTPNPSLARQDLPRQDPIEAKLATPNGLPLPPPLPAASAPSSQRKRKSRWGPVPTQLQTKQTKDGTINTLDKALKVLQRRKRLEAWKKMKGQAEGIKSDGNYEVVSSSSTEAEEDAEKTVAKTAQSVVEKDDLKKGEGIQPQSQVECSCASSDNKEEAQAQTGTVDMLEKQVFQFGQASLVANEALGDSQTQTDKLSHFEGKSLDDMLNLEQSCNGTQNADSTKQRYSDTHVNFTDSKVRESKPTDSDLAAKRDVAGAEGTSRISKSNSFANDETANKTETSCDNDDNAKAGTMQLVSTINRNEALKSGSRKFKGVSARKTDFKFLAHFTNGDKTRMLGVFYLRADAAFAVDEVSEAIKGAGNRPNFDSIEEFHDVREEEMKDKGFDLKTVGTVESLISKVAGSIAKITKKMLIAQTEATKRSLCRNFTGVSLRKSDQKFIAQTTYINKIRNLGVYSLASDSAYVVDRINEALKITGKRPNFESIAKYHEARSQEMKDAGMDLDDVNTIEFLTLKVEGHIAKLTQETMSSTPTAISTMHTPPQRQCTFVSNILATSDTPSHKISNSAQEYNLEKRTIKKGGHNYYGVSHLPHIKPLTRNHRAQITLDTKFRSLGCYHLAADAAWIVDKVHETFKSHDGRRNFDSLEEYHAARKKEIEKTGHGGTSFDNVDSLVLKASEYIAKLAKEFTLDKDAASAFDRDSMALKVVDSVPKNSSTKSDHKKARDELLCFESNGISTDSSSIQTVVKDIDQTIMTRELAHQHNTSSSPWIKVDASTDAALSDYFDIVLAHDMYSNSFLTGGDYSSTASMEGGSFSVDVDTIDGHAIWSKALPRDCTDEVNKALNTQIRNSDDIILQPPPRYETNKLSKVSPSPLSQVKDQVKFHPSNFKTKAANSAAKSDNSDWNMNHKESDAASSNNEADESPAETSMLAPKTFDSNGRHIKHHLIPLAFHQTKMLAFPIGCTVSFCPQQEDCYDVSQTIDVAKITGVHIHVLSQEIFYEVEYKQHIENSHGHTAQSLFRKDDLAYVPGFPIIYSPSGSFDKGDCFHGTVLLRQTKSRVSPSNSSTSQLFYTITARSKGKTRDKYSVVANVAPDQIRCVSDNFEVADSLITCEL